MKGSIFLVRDDGTTESVIFSDDDGDTSAVSLEDARAFLQPPPPSTFQRGDRVRILHQDDPYRAWRNGDLGVVIQEHEGSYFDYDVELDGIGSLNRHYFHAYELQLIHPRDDNNRLYRGIFPTDMWRGR